MSSGSTQRPPIIADPGRETAHAAAGTAEVYRFRADPEDTTTNCSQSPPGLCVRLWLLWGLAETETIAYVGGKQNLSTSNGYGTCCSSAIQIITPSQGSGTVVEKPPAFF
ncbi:MAG TPA: hypothetical protein VMV69_27220 [Pirellulales bacterium]|nr:hypothetical protein [Pirellulales bacterium]